jgi:hypothetical protein
MPEQTHIRNPIGPTAFVEEYGDETVLLTNVQTGRQLVQVVVHREDAHELVKMLRCRLNASRRLA